MCRKLWGQPYVPSIFAMLLHQWLLNNKTAGGQQAKQTLLNVMISGSSVQVLFGFLLCVLLHLAHTLSCPRYWAFGLQTTHMCIAMITTCCSPHKYTVTMVAYQARCCYCKCQWLHCLTINDFLRHYLALCLLLVSSDCCARLASRVHCFAPHRPHQAISISFTSAHVQAPADAILWSI